MAGLELRELEVRHLWQAGGGLERGDLPDNTAASTTAAAGGDAGQVALGVSEVRVAPVIAGQTGW